VSGATTEPFRGVGVALVTIFGDDGEIDPGATGKLAGDLVARGMQAVVVCGSTGEAATLSGPERVALIEAVRGTVPPGTPVIAGTGAPSARQAASLTGDAVRAGADGVLVLPPPGSRDLAGYFTTVASTAGDLPVLAYHYPLVSAPGVPVDALAGLPVAGVKDSSGDPDRLLHELAHYPGATYVGSSAVLALAGPMGAAGAILALANIEPERCVAAFAGDARAQLELADRHLDARRGGVAALKKVLATERGTPAGTRR
jgi:dihydrodipicolinate synthase/N-acetylneuraminate lyase